DDAGGLAGPSGPHRLSKDRENCADGVEVAISSRGKSGSRDCYTKRRLGFAMVVPQDYHTTSKSSPPRRLRDSHALFRDEARHMTRLAVPVVVTYLFQMMPSVITIILVGRVENVAEEYTTKLHLDAASLSVLFVNLVFLAPAFGLLTALDTLCAQGMSARCVGQVR
ncbi:hypothetical protein THAOC_23721, partial [Thalassiosira oceanica]